MNVTEKARYNKTYRQNNKAYYKDYAAKRYVENRQVLCYNCNNAKGVYGECPHRLKRLIDD